MRKNNLKQLEEAKHWNIDYCMLSITNRCNYNCPMCYAKSTSCSQGLEGDLTKLKKIGDSLYAIGTKEVLLLGGDPALYSTLKELVVYLNALGIKVKIQSNSLEFCGMNDIEVMGSFYAIETTIHGYNSTTHDEFCGYPGAYLNALGKLRYYKELGVNVGVAINITPTTYSEIYVIIENLLKNRLTPDYIYFQRIVPTGRADGNSFAPFMLTVDMLKQAAKSIRKARDDFGLNIYYEDCFPYCIFPELFENMMSKCRCGYNWASIDFEGNVYRCPTDTKNVVGNIFEKQLEDIWNNSELLNAFRNKAFLPNECHSCDNFNLCGGGCSISFVEAAFCGTDYLFELCRRGSSVE